MKRQSSRFAGRFVEMIGVLFLLLALESCGPWRAKATEDSEEKRQLLSRHETVARFVDVAYRQCLGRTALCPTRCGNSGDFASFEILRYLAYEKPGQYGDPEQERFTIQVEDNMGNLKMDEKWRARVGGLEAGDVVRLDWRHDYVTRDRSSAPERYITRLKKLSPEEVRERLGKVMLEERETSADSAVAGMGMGKVAARKVLEGASSKITFDLTALNEEGLTGEPNGRRALAYEFCIPATSAGRTEVAAIDSAIRFACGSPGRIDCSSDECLCIGSSHQPDFRTVLRRLAELPYVERIDPCFFE